MSQIVKAFLGVFLTLFLASSSLGVFTMYLEVLYAQDMQARIVDELENSNYHASVIADCFQICGKTGYQLALTVFGEDSSVTTIHSVDEIPAAMGTIDMAKVELQFELKSMFLGIEQTRSFTGYAR